VQAEILIEGAAMICSRFFGVDLLWQRLSR
jgi:hypothetical protein